MLLIFLVLQELDGKSIGNNRTLKVSDVIPRPFEKNNKVALPPHSTEKMEKPSPDSDSNTTQSTNNDEADEDGSLLHSGSVLKGRSARDAVTPLAHMSYYDQLEHKKNSLAQTLKRLVSKLYLLVILFGLQERDLFFFHFLYVTLNLLQSTNWNFGTFCYL